MSYTVIKSGECRPTNDGVYTWGGKILRLLANTAFSETAQDSHTLTMDDLWEVVCGLSNGDIADKLGSSLTTPTTPFSTFRNAFDISVTGEDRHFIFGG